MLTFYSNKEDFKDSSFSDLFNVNGKTIRSGANRETLEFLFKNKKYFIKRFSSGSFLQNILNKLEEALFWHLHIPYLQLDTYL